MWPYFFYSQIYNKENKKMSALDSEDNERTVIAVCYFVIWGFIRVQSRHRSSFCRSKTWKFWRIICERVTECGPWEGCEIVRAFCNFIVAFKQDYPQVSCSLVLCVSAVTTDIASQYSMNISFSYQMLSMFMTFSSEEKEEG